MDINHEMIELFKIKMIDVHLESISEHEKLYLDCISNGDEEVAEYHKGVVNAFEHSVEFIQQADNDLLKMIMAGQIDLHDGFDSEEEAMDGIGYYVCNECFSELNINRLEENGNDVCPLCGESIDWEEIEEIKQEIHEMFDDED